MCGLDDRPQSMRVLCKVKDEAMGNIDVKLWTIEEPVIRKKDVIETVFMHLVQY